MIARAWTAVIASVLVLVAACGGGTTTATEDAAPGFSGRQREVDTETEFELVAPTSEGGPTTTPGAGPTLPLPNEGDRPLLPSSGNIDGERRDVLGVVTTTSTTTTTTTTTTIPGQIILADEASITSICGLGNSIQSMNVLFSSSGQSAEPVMGRLISNLTRYEAVAPAQAKGDIAGLRGDLRAVSDVLRSVGWNGLDPRAQSAVTAIQFQLPPFTELTNRVGRVLLIEAASCPTV